MTTTRGDVPNGRPHHGTHRRGWPALTEALKQAGSPLRAFLTERFPNTRTVFTRYRDDVGPLLVPANTVPTGGGSGAVGGAFDHLVRFLVEPAPDVHPPAIGAWRYGGRMPVALSELAAQLGTHAPTLKELTSAEPTSEFDGPCPHPTPDPELLARGCWALSLLTELGRGVPVERSPLAELNPAAVSGETLLGMASDAALEQIAALRQQAEVVLLPALATRPGRWSVGPTFEGSLLMNADADLIAAGALVEIKTVLGSRKKDGARYATLDGQTLFQLLGYILLDFHDRFGVRELILFSARYGHLAIWELQDLLDTLAGHTVDLAASRAEFEVFLRRCASSAP